MRIVVCAAQVPFSRGGAELHVEGLHQALSDAGHEVETVALPFKWYPHVEILKSALAWRMIDLTEADGKPIDLVICTKFPTWAVRHPNKVAWIIHQYRQAYDWFGTEYSDLTGSAEDLALRRRIQRIDARGLGECRTRFANSANTAGRLQRYNGLTAEPLHVPIQLRGLNSESYEPYIFTVSRLDRSKRVDLLIRAAARTKYPTPVVIAGDGPERGALESLARSLGVGESVRFLGRADDSTVRDHYNRCRAVYYGPIDEDFGLVTVEAFTARKPVISISDAGGVLELTEHELSGLVADEPDPTMITPLIDRLMRDESEARTLGENGSLRIQHITWPNVIERLVGRGQ